VGYSAGGFRESRGELGLGRLDVDFELVPTRVLLRGEDCVDEKVFIPKLMIMQTPWPPMIALKTASEKR
jgi:hypothetical protein